MSSVLIINPNCSQQVTENLKEILDPPPDITYKFFTAPSGPSEVNSHTTGINSAYLCFQAIHPVLKYHDAFLIASYGEHPLIGMLREHTNKPVLGIFEASILQSLAFGDGKFAIITTTERGVPALDNAVFSLLGSRQNYVGAFSTGMDVLGLHEASPEFVKSKFGEATKEAVEGGARTLILGCAGMSGMDAAVKSHCPSNVRVLDAVVSGCEMVVGLLRTTI